MARNAAAVRADLDLIDSILRRSTMGPQVKHHELSMALMALERIERDLSKTTQPPAAPTEEG